MYHIMIIEDDETIRDELSLILQNSGYQTSVITDFEHTLLQLQEINPDLLLLDIQLPGMDGFKLCMEIRAFSKLPVIFVTSQNSELDELKSITLGGDDFITKPYHISILLARISALLKRSYSGEQHSLLLKHKDVTLNVVSSDVSYKNNTIELTKNELQILYYLFTHKGQISKRDDIIDFLWDNKLFIDDNALSVNITRIRTKLKQIGAADLIKTKHRQGYLL